MKIENYKIFLKEFKKLPPAQELADFIVKNLPNDYTTSRQSFVTRAALYCDMLSMTFHLIYRGKRKQIAVQNYRKLVIGWAKLHVELKKG